MLDTRNYKVVEFSWNEKRQDLFSGIDTLPPVLKAEALAAIDLLNAKPHGRSRNPIRPKRI